MYEQSIFVFGSNLLGIHGAGAALHAKKYFSAKQGIGVGPTGNAYALPTKRTPYESLSLPTIETHVKNFLAYASNNPDQRFLVTPIGTGLAGYSHEEIAPLFKDAPNNCVLSTKWDLILGRNNDEQQKHEFP